MVAHPDGALGAYLESLDRLHALADAHEIETIWPGHGPVIADALPALDHYLAHRQQRLDQVRDALRSLHAAAGRRTLDHEPCPRRIVEIVYADVDEVLWPAAELSVRAQLAYLRARQLNRVFVQLTERLNAREVVRTHGSCGRDLSGRGAGGGRPP